MGAHGLHVHPTPDVTIDYFAAGSGASVVLLHGLGESRRTWDPLLAPLIAAGNRVTAVDLRGHGDSSRCGPYDLGTMAADVGVVLEHEAITDALVVGHGIGALVAVAVAGAGRCRAVVCVDRLLDESPTDAAVLPSTLELPSHERWRVEQLRVLDPDVVSGVLDLDVARTALASRSPVPLLSIHGTAPVDGYDRRLAALHPGSVCEWWPEAGGYPHLVDPQRFVERLTAFDPGRG